MGVLLTRGVWDMFQFKTGSGVLNAGGCSTRSHTFSVWMEHDSSVRTASLLSHGEYPYIIQPPFFLHIAERTFSFFLEALGYSSRWDVVEYRGLQQHVPEGKSAKARSCFYVDKKQMLPTPESDEK